MLISHLLNVQEFMRISIVPGPAVYKYPWATAATVNHQAIIKVRVTCICRTNICHPGQVPVKGHRLVNTCLTIALCGHTCAPGYLWKWFSSLVQTVCLFPETSIRYSSPMRHSTKMMRSSCLREGNISRGTTWHDKLKCHDAGKRHEKLILSASKKEDSQNWLYKKCHSHTHTQCQR